MTTLSIQDLSYVTPDGHTVFNNLSLTLSSGCTGLVGSNGSGKSTLLKLVSGELTPASGSLRADGLVRVLKQDPGSGADRRVSDVFGVTGQLAALRRALSGAAGADDLGEIDWTLDERLAAALAIAGVEGVSADRCLDTLSGGQRVRVALAALMFDGPELMLMDEPTNNLDLDGRAAVKSLLRGFKGAALVASHDRDLLRHMDRIVELSELGARTYGGNWDFYVERRAEERAAAEHRLLDAERNLKHVERAIQIDRERQARREAMGRKTRRGGGNIKSYFDAQKERAGTALGHAKSSAEGRKARAVEAVEQASAAVERISSLSAGLASCGLARSKTVLSVDRVTAGYDPGSPVLRDVSFSLVGPERAALTGPNGCGKTTALKLILGELAPDRGSVRLAVNAAALDQHVGVLVKAETLVENFCRLNPLDDDNACRAALARFLFRADDALRRAETLSGGELLRAGLACVLGGRNVPQLLILDEPTNHLDLSSIAAVEEGLRGYDGALLVVSHDEAFLQEIGIERRIALG